MQEQISEDELFQLLTRNAEMKVYVLLLPGVEYIMTVILFLMVETFSSMQGNLQKQPTVSA